MALSFDAHTAAAVDTFPTANSTQTVSHTVGATANALVVVVSYQGNFVTTGVTWNGVAMTHILDGGGVGQEHVEFWVLANPATGTHNAVASFSVGQSSSWMDVSSWIGANTSSLVGVSSAATDTASPDSLSTSMAAGSIAIDAIFTNGTSLTPVGSQTRMAADGGAFYERYGTSYLAGATAMAWTHSGMSRSGHAVIELKAAGGGGKASKNTNIRPLGMRAGMSRRLVAGQTTSRLKERAA